MGRTPCCEKRGLKKGPWTPEEDQKLLDYIQKHGHGNWRTLPKNAGLERCGKSCRLRWTNYLRPDIKRGRFSFEEEEIIIQLHSVLGNKWSAIAARLPGRTDNEIKNYWNTHIRKKLLRMGIDPVTHTPRYDLFDLSSILSSSLYNSSHHQLNVSRSLGLQMPVVNPEVLQLVTTLLSSQRENSINQDQLLLQNLQESQLGQAQLIQNQQFPSLIDQIQSNCPTSSTPADTILGESTQLMQPNIQQYESSFTGLVDGNADLQNYGYLGLQDESAVSCFVPENSSNLIQSHINSHENLQQCNLASVLSTPSSSTSTHPLNSYSSTHVNSSGVTEDENSKDSYCSDGFKFEVPATLIMDATGFM